MQILNNVTRDSSQCAQDIMQGSAVVQSFPRAISTVLLDCRLRLCPGCLILWRKYSTKRDMGKSIEPLSNWNYLPSQLIFSGLSRLDIAQYDPLYTFCSALFSKPSKQRYTMSNMYTVQVKYIKCNEFLNQLLKFGHYVSFKRYQSINHHYVCNTQVNLKKMYIPVAENGCFPRISHTKDSVAQ